MVMSIVNGHLSRHDLVILVFQRYVSCISKRQWFLMFGLMSVVALMGSHIGGVHG